MILKHYTLDPVFACLGRTLLSNLGVYSSNSENDSLKKGGFRRVRPEEGEVPSEGSVIVYSPYQEGKGRVRLYAIPMNNLVLEAENPQELASAESTLKKICSDRSVNIVDIGALLKDL
ncbi:MAG: hypothetical protein WC796_03735 [Candidatus Pacearchaeota archaeon]|jgi:hypothetical protein